MRIPSLPPPPRPPLRAVVACAALLGLLAGAWLLVRDSPLVSVRRVSVVGASGPDAASVRAALIRAGHDMTTLHVREGQLATAVEPYPDVARVEAHSDFPHGLRLVVHEHVAVAALAVAGRRVAVAADGTVLRDLPTAGLPTVVASAPPIGEVVDDPHAASAVALLAAAPSPLRSRVRGVTFGPRGLSATLRNGPALYFGDPARLRAKWTAIVRVLDDRTSAGAAYLDVRLPERPASPVQDPSTSPQVGVQAAQPQLTEAATP
jgi:cell division protein FtsQ